MKVEGGIREEGRRLNILPYTLPCREPYALSLFSLIIKKASQTG